jgi:sodium-coupled neutral amino acid transporter 11
LDYKKILNNDHDANANPALAQSVMTAERASCPESSSSTDAVEVSVPVHMAADEQSTRNIPDHGSSIGGAVFNFSNCIIGAGAIGLGGAFAVSGGLVSVAAILFFGILTKFSLDMVIELSVETEGAHSSYEELGEISFGSVGWAFVIISKTLYSFGCLVAYIIVVKDNFAMALSHLVYGSAPSHRSWFAGLLGKNDLVTLILSTCVILPLCLLRDMSSLTNLSAVSVVSMCFIVMIVVYIYFDNPGGDIRQGGGTVYENWFEVRSGFLQRYASIDVLLPWCRPRAYAHKKSCSLGTFVFTFVSQHTVHLTYESLRSDIRNVKNWKKVSTYTLVIATGVSLAVGVVVYVTFWQHAESDLFNMYPPLRSIDLAKILLCITMLLTFPLPFFTCRDMIILSGTHSRQHDTMPAANEATDENVNASLQQPLLLDEDIAGAVDSPSTRVRDRDGEHLSSRILLDEEERQLKQPYHVVVTVSLWSLTTLLAILAPSLGDVLDLVGCATGTVIAFILPSLFSFRLRGYTHLAAFLLVVGGVVGSVGTTFSILKLFADV